MRCSAETDSRTKSGRTLLCAPMMIQQSPREAAIPSFKPATVIFRGLFTSSSRAKGER